MAPSKGGIVISYRRRDASAAARAIYERLAPRYAGRIFMDVESIGVGVDYRERIGKALEHADVLLALIGKQWAGRSRIGQPDDPVRIEIEEAFAHDVRIVPVLLENAAMPAAASLPESIRELAYLNAARVRLGADFNSDIRALQRAIDGGRGARANVTNLPNQISAFVGRGADLARIAEAIAQSRLVTIIGPGGIGKTRIAIELAARQLDDFADGAWFIPLAAVSGEFVLPAVAGALGVAEISGEPLLNSVLRHVSEQNALLVIDNSEHVLAEVAELINVILAQAPGVSCLVTSREALHVTGEFVRRLGPLAESRELFLNRARALDAGEDFDDAVVDRICERLGGIPFAIELAAARCATIPLARLEDELRRSVTALANRDPSAPERSRTLRQTIDWSYRLLSDDEKRTFAALSVFAASWPLEAAHAVAGNGASNVESLVEKSLVQAIPRAGRQYRYLLLDPIREFAREQALAFGIEMHCRQQHLNYYATIAASTRAPATRDASMHMLDASSADVRAALSFAESDNSASYAAFVHDLTTYWNARTSITEARFWLERAMGVRRTLPSRQAADVLYDFATFAALQDDLVSAANAVKEALTMYRDLGEISRVGASLHRLATLEHRYGNLADAAALYAQAQRTIEGDPSADSLRVACIVNRAMIARQQGHADEALVLAAQALTEADAIGEAVVAAQAIDVKAYAQLERGQIAPARAAFEEELARSRAAQNAFGECAALHGLANVELRAGDSAAARVWLAELVKEALDRDLRPYLFRAAYGLAASAALDGDLYQAARCIGLGDRLFAESGRTLRDNPAYDIARQRIAGGLDEASAAEAAADGARLKIEDVVA